MPIKNTKKSTEIANRIFKKIALLKKDHPHFAKIEPLEEKIHRESSPFEISFLYSYNMDYVKNPRWKPNMKIPEMILAPTKADGIYINIKFFEKGIYMGQRVIPPLYIGDMHIIMDILGGSDKIRDKIWSIINAENPKSE